MATDAIVTLSGPITLPVPGGNAANLSNASTQTVSVTGMTINVVIQGNGATFIAEGIDSAGCARQVPFTLSSGTISSMKSDIQTALNSLNVLASAGVTATVT